MSTKWVNLPVPTELASFFKWPPILENESPSEYQDIFDAVAEQIKPRNKFEWLLSGDLSDTIWEIRRLKKFKATLVDMDRRMALQQVLEAIADGNEEERRRFADKNTELWFRDFEHREPLELLMQKHGFRAVEVDAQAMANRLPELEILRPPARARTGQSVGGSARN
jgi:hypothetical protein